MRSGFRLPRDSFANLIERAISLTGEPGIGFLLGLQMRVSCHGVIGQAAMVARTLGEALEIARAYFDMPSSDLQLRIERESGHEGDIVRLSLGERDERYRLSEVGAQFLLTGFAAMAEALTGRKLKGEGVMRFPALPIWNDMTIWLPASSISTGPSTVLYLMRRFWITPW